MFYHFSQNNSGGGFNFDEESGITHHVVIEADSPQEANRIAADIGLYFNGCASDYDCPCCGDRWYPKWSDDEGDAVPSVYRQDITHQYIDSYDRYWIGKGKEAVIHYKNGDVVFR